MTSTGIRWAILGAGGIAKRFATELAESRTGTLVAVGSRDEGRARAFADELRPGADLAVGGYDEILARDDVDAVYVAVVHRGHPELTIQALRAGKHVICEKPLAVDHAAAMVMVEEAARAGRYLAEGYMVRFHPQFQLVRDLVGDGTIGEIAHIEARFSFRADVPDDSRLRSADLAGGGILDVGGYTLSLARAVAGAAVGELVAEPIELTGSGTIGATGVDLWATAQLRFASGITADLSCGVAVDDAPLARIVGSGGVIEIEQPWLPATDADAIVVVRTPDGTTRRAAPATFQYAAQADELADRVAAGELETPRIGWADSLGNAAALDRWRAAVGVEYPFEHIDAPAPTVSGLPLTRLPGTAMPTGTIDGIATPLSRLVFGCDNQLTLRHAAAVFDDFIERGGNTFDTAWLYGSGLQERLVGRWLAERGIRDDVVLIGKGGHTPYNDPESVTRQLHESLDRLGTDRIDLYFLHRDNPAVPVGEFVDVLDEHARAGRITRFGGSNWSVERFEAANAYAEEHGKLGFSALSNHFGLARAHDVPWAGCVEMTSPADRRWLEETNTPLLPWSSQARGFFTGRAAPDRHDDPDLERCYYSDENFERLRRARVLAEQLGVQPTAIALAYVLAQRFPTFALIGPRTVQETRSSFAGLDVTLDEAQVAWLDLRTD